MAAAKYLALMLVLVLVLVLAACARREPAAQLAPDAAATLEASIAPSVATAAVTAPAAPSRAPAIDALAVAVPVADWVWKAYRGDHFTVLFPGEPKVTVSPGEDDKVGYSEVSFHVPGGQVSFAAVFTEHSQEDVSKPDGFLDDRANATRRGFTEVLHKRAIRLPGGQPGRVLIERRNISGTPLRVYSRLYLVGRRLYSLIVSTLDVNGVGEDIVKKFMDSFKLL